MNDAKNDNRFRASVMPDFCSADEFLKITLAAKMKTLFIIMFP
jgi:hypothetical protein